MKGRFVVILNESEIINLAEVEIIDETGVNIAPNSNVYVSEEQSDKFILNNNDYDHYAVVKSPNSYIVFDLLEEHDISKIKIYNRLSDLVDIRNLIESSILKILDESISPTIGEYLIVDNQHKLNDVVSYETINSADYSVYDTICGSFNDLQLKEFVIPSQPQISSVTFENDYSNNTLIYFENTGILSITFDDVIYESIEKFRSNITFDATKINIISQQKRESNIFEYTFEALYNINEGLEFNSSLLIEISFQEVNNPITIIVNTIEPYIMHFEIDKTTVTYEDTSINGTIQFSKDLIETNEEFKDIFIMEPSDIFIINETAHSTDDLSTWNITIGISGEKLIDDISLNINYRGSIASKNNISVRNVIPELLTLNLEKNTFTFQDNSANIIIQFSNHLVDDKEAFLQNFVNITPNDDSVFITNFENSLADKTIWTGILVIKDNYSILNGAISVQYNDITLVEEFNANTIIPNVEYITLSPSIFVVNPANITNDIGQDVSNGTIQIKFETSIEESNINSFIHVVDRNNAKIPNTEIQITNLESEDGITWDGSFQILQYQLYYYASELMINYYGNIKRVSFDLDTVKSNTFTNKLLGPKREVLFSNYLPGYEIRRINSQIVYMFDDNLSRNSLSIIGIKEKTFEYNTDPTSSIPIGYNSNFSLYNTNEGIIDTNTDFGSISSDNYDFQYKIGFFTFTLTEKTYSELMISLIIECLERWTSYVDSSHTLSIVFNITEIQGEEFDTEIIQSTGDNIFGTTFPTLANIKMDTNYIEDKINLSTNAFNNSNNKKSIKHRISRSIGNALGIGHYWELTGAPIAYDTANIKYYTGENALKEYRNILKDQIQLDTNKIFGVPIENYSDKNIYLEEGEQLTNEGEQFINGFTHPGLGQELMTYWIDTDAPISSITLGLLDDIGYDICYNNLESYTIANVVVAEYNIYMTSLSDDNIFARLSATFFLLKNNFNVKLISSSTQSDFNAILGNYTSTVLNHVNAQPVNYLTVIHDLDLTYSWGNDITIDSNTYPILQNINDNANEIETSSNIKEYILTSIRKEDNSYIFLLDKKLY